MRELDDDVVLVADEEADDFWVVGVLAVLGAEVAGGGEAGPAGGDRAGGVTAVAGGVGGGGVVALELAVVVRGGVAGLDALEPVVGWGACWAGGDALAVLEDSLNAFVAGCALGC